MWVNRIVHSRLCVAHLLADWTKDVLIPVRQALIDLVHVILVELLLI